MKKEVEIIDTVLVDCERRTRKQWLIAVLVNITLLGYGMQMGWIAVTAKVLQSDQSPAGVPFSSGDISWLASSPSLAAMMSIPLFTLLVDRVGRKPCILACATLQLVSWIIKLSFIKFASLMVARVLGGVSAGSCIYVMPMYLKEISRDDIRVNITLLGYGMQMGWIAVTAKVLQSDQSPAGVPFSSGDISWLASSPSLAAMMSIPLFTLLVDRVGRKPCILACATLQLVSWIIKLSFIKFASLMVARVLGGVSAGSCIYVMPMYLKEISRDDIRVNITLLGYGMQMGWIAVTAKVLQSDQSPAGVPFSSGDISWLASSPSLAAMMSIPLFTLLVDRVGRKPCILACATLQLVSWIIKLSFIKFASLMVARVLGGVSAGSCIYVMPMYLKEISRDDIRVNITLLGYGMQMGWIAVTAKVLQSDQSPAGVPFSSGDISWLASSPSLAAMMSIPLFTLLVDRVGRKPCILACATLQLVSWIIKLSFIKFASLMVARVLGGVSAGSCIYVMPMYLKEISRDDIRGALGMTLSMARNFGLLLMYIIGGYLDYYMVLWISLPLAVINVVTMLFAPESPTYYVKIGKIDAAASSIAYLRELSVEDKVVNNAIDLLRSEDERFKSIPNVTFIVIFKQKAWRKGFMFMILVMIAHGLNGGFSIISYGPAILVQCGLHFDPELQSLSVPGFMIVGGLLSIVLIDRLGRRILLTLGFLLAMLSFMVLSASIMVRDAGGQVPGWVTVVALVVPMCTYAAAVSSVPFVVMAEMFNFQIRAKVMGCLVMLGWLGGFTQTLIFIPMTNALGLHITFICAAVVNLFGVAVALVLLPETKAKSVDEIEMELEKKLQRK